MILYMFLDYWQDKLGMKTYTKTAKSAILGYADDQCKLELVDIGTSVDGAKAFGRIAFSCPQQQVTSTQRQSARQLFRRLWHALA